MIPCQKNPVDDIGFFFKAKTHRQVWHNHTHTHSFFLNRGIITDYRILVTCGAECRLYISSHWGMTRGLLWTPKLLHEIVTNNRISQAGRRFIWRFGQNKMGRFSETTTKHDQTIVWFSKDCFRHAFFQHSSQSSRLDYLHSCRGSMGESLYARDSVADRNLDEISWDFLGARGSTASASGALGWTKFIGFPFKLIKLARMLDHGIYFTWISYGLIHHPMFLYGVSPFQWCHFFLDHVFFPTSSGCFSRFFQRISRFGDASALADCAEIQLAGSAAHRWHRDPGICTMRDWDDFFRR